MAKYFPFLVLILFLFASIQFSSSAVPTLRQGSSLSVENPDDVLVSPRGVFSAGFYPVGHNAYCFAIWFSKPCHDGNHTTVWMANRDTPVNGRRSKLSILKTGNVILTDAGEVIIWTSDNRDSESWSELKLLDSGNLVLQTPENVTLWQSFDSPTDTLLPNQPLTRYKSLVSARSQTNYSSGFYKLIYDYDNVLRLVLDGPETSSIYWPDSTLLDYQQGRTRYNDSRIAVFDSQGYFTSSDKVEFRSTDFGRGPWRRLKLDFDGNLRLYTLEDQKGVWSVTWQVMSNPCRIHGACGPNSICSYDPSSGPKCSCPPGFKMKNQADWTDGCEPEFDLSCSNHDIEFVKLRHVNFFGYYYDILRNYTLKECAKACLDSCCIAFQYRYFPEDGAYRCYPKRELRNGHRYSSYNGTLYLKLPKSFTYDKPVEEFKLNCSSKQTKQLERAYQKETGYGSLKILIWCASVIGLIEMICIILVFCFLYKTQQSSDAATGEVWHQSLEEWVKGKKNGAAATTSWVVELIDPAIGYDYDRNKLENLLEVAIKCTEADRHARPSMSRVVQMLVVGWDFLGYNQLVGISCVQESVDVHSCDFDVQGIGIFLFGYSNSRSELCKKILNCFTQLV
ncbi:hypothetical protein SCA6_001747 [Theobroma cacao]